VLLEEYPGNYNYLLTNGSVLFAFSNHRQFMLLKGSQMLEGGCCSPRWPRASARRAGRWSRDPRTNKGILMAIMGTDIVMEKTLG
jgi:hypothetical protein